MSDRSTIYLIMTLVAILVILGILSGFAHASRSCLNRAEAARTWPTKQLATDPDGCWTYVRRGITAAPEEPVLTPAPKETAETVTTLDMVDRWPIVIRVEPKQAAAEPDPMMKPREVVAWIVSVVLAAAVIEVAFGGLIKRRWG